MIKRNIVDESSSLEEKLKESPSCSKVSEFYYPGCFQKYKDALIECESNSDCVGIIKHFVDPMSVAKHAPDGYYLCYQNFTISQTFFEVNSDETNRPKEVYKKKKGKGKSNFLKFDCGSLSNNMKNIVS